MCVGETEMVEGAMETFLYLALGLEKMQTITGCWDAERPPRDRTVHAKALR